MRSALEILQVALTKEKQAHDFYNGFLMQCKTTELRVLIEKLRDEEAKHVAMIEAMLAQMNVNLNP